MPTPYIRKKEEEKRIAEKAKARCVEFIQWLKPRFLRFIFFNVFKFLVF